jgi:hypothetical protein
MTTSIGSPNRLQSDERSRTEAVRQAIRHAQLRVEQNYKIAIPQYYWPAYGGRGQAATSLATQPR